MAFSQLTNNLNIIQALDRYPNTNNGLTYSQLQAKFDEAAGLIKTYLNSTLLTELSSTTDNSSGADNIGATAITNLTGTTVQALLESLRNNLKSTTDSASGADFVSATSITDLTGTTVQSILESLRDKLKSTTDSASGADFINATAISGLTGTTVQALLEALDSALTAHKSSADHDGRYYTETELNNGQLDTRYYTETELNNGQLDNRYYTETEVDGFTVKLTGNQTVAGIKTFSSSPIVPAPTTDLQVSTKKYVDDTVAGATLGSIPDNSLSNAKLVTDIKVGSLASAPTTDKSSVINVITEVNNNIGTLSSLNTTSKTSSVSAINEVNNNVGTLSSLNTTSKTSSVSAINEVNNNIGTLSTLNTTSKTSAVSAINEVNTSLATLPTKTYVDTGDLKNSLDLAKGLFTLQSQMTAGLNSLSQMAIDTFNDETGVDTKTNQSYDSTNKLYKPTLLSRSAKTMTPNGNVKTVTYGVNKVGTCAGNAQVSTTKFKFGSSSLSLDGTGDYVSYADDVDFHFLNGDFTLSCWVNLNAYTTGNSCIFAQNNDGSTFYRFYIKTNGALYVSASVSSTIKLEYESAAQTWTLGQWYHVAFVRSGSTMYMFRDGVLLTVTTLTAFTTMNDLTGNATIGQENAGAYFNGYIDEFHLSKGIARYTSAFTPPTTTETADTYTKLLLHFEGANTSTFINDDSLNVRPKAGTGMAYLDGTGDYIQTPSSADFDFTGNYTVEFWVYRITASVTNYVMYLDWASGTHYGHYIGLQAAGNVTVGFAKNSAPSTVMTVTSTGGGLTTGAWHHVAVVKSGLNVTIYLNGTQVGSGTLTEQPYAWVTGRVLNIGIETGQTVALNGYLDQYHMTKSVKYTGAFTPPTTLSGDVDTKLLMLFDGTNGGTTFTDSLTANSMTLISSAFTCASAPTQGYVTADETLNGQTITYSLSRDNGTTWTTATKDTLVSLTSQPSGTSLKVKAVTSGGYDTVIPNLKAWAFGYK